MIVVFIIYKLMKCGKILLNYNAYFQKVIFSQVTYNFFIFHCQVFIFHLTELRVKHYTTKRKICFPFSINFLYNKTKIQIFGVNMTFISSFKATNEIYIFSLHDEIKVTFTPNIWIISMILLVAIVSVTAATTPCMWLTFTKDCR